MKVGTYPVLHLFRREQAVRLGHLPLPVHPVRLDPVELGALARRWTDQDAYAPALRLHAPVVRPNLGPDHVARVPARVIPDEDTHALASRLLGRAPLPELRRHHTHRTTLDEAQPHRLLAPAHIARRRKGGAVAREHLRLSVRYRLFHQTFGAAGLGPPVSGRRSHATPPGIFVEAHGPVGMDRRLAQQAVPGGFFPRVLRIGTFDSPLGAPPLEAESYECQAHRLGQKVERSHARLGAEGALSCRICGSRSEGSSAANVLWIVFSTDGLRRSASKPSRSNARIAPRAPVSGSHPNARAICRRGLCPGGGEQDLRSPERERFWRAERPLQRRPFVAVSGRTKMWGFMPPTIQHHARG